MVRRLIAIPGCDKNMPGCVIAMGRLNRPALVIYGGTIRPGELDGRPLDIVSALECYGEFLSGRSTTPRARRSFAIPAPARAPAAACTRPTPWPAPIEALGMSLPYSSSTPAEDPQKRDECFRAGPAVRHLLERDIKPRDILTRKAFENAMTVVIALGGSTNAVLHLIAMARAAGVPLAHRRFPGVSDRVPYLADFKPSGRYVQEDLHQRGRHAGRDEVPAGRRATRTAIA